MKKTSKRLLIMVSAMLMALLLFSGCAAKPASQPDSVNLAVLKGPTGIGAAYLMDTAESETDSQYQVSLVETPEQVVAQLTSGGVDIAALPSNLAANLYAKTEGEIQAVAFITRGMLYLLEEGDSIQSWDDLQGQTIYATARGSNPEFVLNHLLNSHNLDTVVEFKSEHAELAALLAAGEVKVGMLPEPFVTSALMQNDKLRIAFDLSAEWDAMAQDGQMIMTALVVRREFAEQYPAAVTNALADLEASIKYANENVDEAAQLCEKYAIIPKAAVAKQAIPRCNLTFVAGSDMRPAVEGFYRVLFEANPQSIGGALPDEDFYYIP